MAGKKEFWELSREEYEGLKSLGYLYEFYPEATGDYLSDMWSLTATPQQEDTEAPQSALEMQVDGSHYVTMKMQPIELTYALNASPCFCKLAKYLTREKGDKLTNLKKALHCIKLEDELINERNKGELYPFNRAMGEVMFKRSKADVIDTIYAFTDNVEVANILINMYEGEYKFASDMVEILINSLDN